MKTLLDLVLLNSRVYKRVVGVRDGVRFPYPESLFCRVMGFTSPSQELN